MKTWKIFIISVSVVGAVQGIALAAESSDDEILVGKAISLAPVEVDLSQSLAASDNKGTDIAHTYIFTANNIKDGANKDQHYIVMFYLDGILLEGFRDQILPVSIMKNLKGLSEGPHEIRVDIEDNSNNGVVLSSQTTTVNIEP